MDEHAMSALAALSWPLSALLSFAGGVGLGFCYFRALRQTTEMLIGGGSMLLALGLTLGRVATIAAGFYLASRLGATALLAAFAGAMIGRMIIMAQQRRAP